MRIVYSNDFLFHGQEEYPAVFHKEFFSLVSIVIEEASGVKPVSISQCADRNGDRFSRKRFFELSGIGDPAPMYFLYDINRISAESWEYFSSFFDAETFFVGMEFGLELREKLTGLGITYVNFWFHPFKLLGDAFFLVGTNSASVFAELEKFKVCRARMRVHGEYYAQLAMRKHFSDSLPLEDNSCLFVGQTYQDKSIADNGKYLNITDYPQRIDELSAQYSKIYYVPHPLAGKNDDVDAFIAARPYIKVLAGTPTYYLLASPKIQKVVALSSSVLYEAEFFGKDTEYLFRPLFDIDGEFSLNAFVSIYQDYFGPMFWRSVLAAWRCEPVVNGDLPDNLANDTLLARDAGLFRDLLGEPYGFRFLGRMERLEARVRAEFKPDRQSYVFGQNMIPQDASGVSLDGFYKLEPFGRWAKERVTLTVKGDNFRHLYSDLVLYLKIKSFHEPRKAEISVNGRLLGSQVIDHSAFAEVAVKVDRRILGPKNVIEIVAVGDVASPADLGLGSDLRRLAFAVESARLVEDVGGQFRELDAKVVRQSEATAAGFGRIAAAQKDASAEIADHGAIIGEIRKSLDDAHVALREANAKIAALQNSRSFKIGRAMTCLPRVVRRIFK